ncbi:Conserved_hypothetical protein [Hexamita inflata]|uniref:Ankyrin repeat-containing protein n=1 Tax=Hexamita inflata TaxID=28002 RepID=A0AA86UV41_9EUKA|nr:Conserved hypothetical protein [Hexamita inflata]
MTYKSPYPLDKERQMYLTVINEHAYFYADNYCYKCDYNLNVIEQQPIDFPYLLQKGIENFPVFGHDFPQLFKSHECQGRFYTNVFDTIYEFSEFKVTKRITLPDIDPYQVQNNKCASCMDRLFVTNGKLLFEVLVDQDYQLQEIPTHGFKFNNLKLHVMNNNLFLRDPHSRKFYKLMLNDQIVELHLDFSYSEIVIDNKDIMLFYFNTNIYYLLYFNQDVKTLKINVDYNISSKQHEYIITNYGWSIDYKIIDQIVAQNQQVVHFNQRLQLNNPIPQNNFTVLSQNVIKYLKYNSNFMQPELQQNQLSSLQQTDYIIYLGLTKQFQLLEECIRNKTIHKISQLTFEFLHDFHDIKLLSQLVQNQVLQLNFVAVFSDNPLFDTLNIELSEENLVQDVILQKFKLKKYFKLIEINRENLLLMIHKFFHIDLQVLNGFNNMQKIYRLIRGDIPLDKERQMYLTVINEHAYFYADNYCYKCDYNLNVIEQQPIDFPYLLQKGIENFPVFGHDFPQLFKSHECQGRFYTNVFDTIYEFSEFKVTKRITLPDIDPYQVQNNKCASCMDRLFVTNGKLLFEVLVDQDYQLQEIPTHGFKFNNLKLHVMNNNLFLRDPHSRKFYKLMLNDQIVELHLDFSYSEIVIDNKDIMLFYFNTNIYYLLYFNQDVKTLKINVDYNISSKQHEYIITNYGWSIDYKIIDQIVAQNQQVVHFNQRLQLNNPIPQNNFTVLSQNVIKYLKYNSNFMQPELQQNQLSSLQQTDYIIYLGLTKQFQLLEECIRNKTIHKISQLTFEFLHDFHDIKLLSQLVQNQVLQLNFVAVFSDNPLFDTLNIELSEENLVQDVILQKFKLKKYFKLIEINRENLLLMIKQSLINQQFSYLKQLFEYQSKTIKSMSGTKFSPIDLIIQSKNLDLIQEVHKNYPDLRNSQLQTALMLSVHILDDIPTCLFSQLQCQTKAGMTALMFAAQYQTKIYPQLLEEKFKMNNEGETALYFAVINKNLDHIQLLVDEAYILVKHKHILCYISMVYDQLNSKQLCLAIAQLLFDKIKEYFEWYPLNIENLILKTHSLSNQILFTKYNLREQLVSELDFELKYNLQHYDYFKVGASHYLCLFSSNIKYLHLKADIFDRSKYFLQCLGQQLCDQWTLFDENFDYQEEDWL